MENVENWDAEPSEDDEDNDTDNNISVKEESTEEAYTAIKDINTIQEINMAQMNINPETREPSPQVSQEDRVNTQHSHSYNMRSRPAKRNQFNHMSMC